MIFSEADARQEAIKEIFNTAGSSCEISLHESQLCINDFIVLPVYGVDSSTQIDTDIPIKNDTGNEIGVLCPLILNGYAYEINRLTIPRLICMVSEIGVEIFDLPELKQYFFKSHYLLISKSFYNTYKERYSYSSAIWGGFTHEPSVRKYERQQNEILLIDGIKIPTNKHKIDLMRAINSTTGFERFLKYYHQLELLFDLIFVSKVRSLPTDSISGFGKLIKEYQKKELENLKYMMVEYIDDATGLFEIIDDNYANGRQGIMLSIFQDHSKDGNPLLKSGNNRWVEFMSFMNVRTFTAAEAIKNKYPNVKTDDDLRVFIIELCAYWIYRIRCSVAHNKIGEFIFDDTHEEFVVEFGEALVREVIMKIFSNNSLKSLF